MIFWDMNHLRTYLNSLEKQKQIEYADKCGTSINYLRNVLSKKRRPKMDAALALKLDKYSGGKVPKWEIRPDVWPELVPDEASVK